MRGLIITGVEKSDGMEIYFYGSGQQGFVAQLALLVYDYVLAVMGLLPLLYDLTWPDLMASGKEFRHRPAGPRQADDRRTTFSSLQNPTSFPARRGIIRVIIIIRQVTEEPDRLLLLPANFGQTDTCPS